MRRVRLGTKTPASNGVTTTDTAEDIDVSTTAQLAHSRRSRSPLKSRHQAARSPEEERARPSRGDGDYDNFDGGVVSNTSPQLFYRRVDHATSGRSRRSRDDSRGEGHRTEYTRVRGGDDDDEEEEERRKTSHRGDKGSVVVVKQKHRQPDAREHLTMMRKKNNQLKRFVSVCVSVCLYVCEKVCVIE